MLSFCNYDLIVRCCHRHAYALIRQSGTGQTLSKTSSSFCITSLLWQMKWAYLNSDFPICMECTSLSKYCVTCKTSIYTNQENKTTQTNKQTCNRKSLINSKTASNTYMHQMIAINICGRDQGLRLWLEQCKQVARGTCCGLHYTRSRVQPAPHSVLGRVCKTGKNYIENDTELSYMYMYMHMYMYCTLGVVLRNCLNINYRPIVAMHANLYNHYYLPC